MILTIDTDKITQLKSEAGNIFTSAEGDAALVDFLKIKQSVEDIEKEIKAILDITARKYDPNFKSIQSDNVKISRRTFGQKYYVEEENLALAPKELFKSEVSAIVPNDLDVKAIEEKLRVVGMAIKETEKDGQIEKKFKRIVDSKAVEKWEKETGKMPTGIVEIADRSTSISITLKKI